MDRKRTETLWDLTFRIALWCQVLSVLALLVSFTLSIGAPIILLPSPVYVVLDMVSGYLLILLVLSLVVLGTAFIVRRVVRDLVADENFRQEAGQ